jgi:hypothetical protein
VIRKRPFERVQLPAGDIHTLFVLCRMQQRKLPAQFGRMSRLNTRLAPGQKKLFQTRVPERLNHA